MFYLLLGVDRLRFSYFILCLSTNIDRQLMRFVNLLHSGPEAQVHRRSATVTAGEVCGADGSSAGEPAGH